MENETHHLICTRPGCSKRLTSIISRMRLVHRCAAGHVTLGRVVLYDPSGARYGLSLAELASLDGWTIEQHRLTIAQLDADRVSAGLVEA